MPHEAENRVGAARGDAGRQAGAAFGNSTRGRLMAAMAAVVAHGGYRDATVDKVLERAHVGWSAFTSEFEDLDDCFLATFEAGATCAVGCAERAVAALPPTADEETVFTKALDAILEAIAAYPDVAHLCLVDSAALGIRGVQHKEAALQGFVTLIGPRPSGDARAASPLAAEMVAGGIYEVLQRKAHAHELAEVPAIGAELRELWLPVLRGVTGRR